MSTLSWDRLQDFLAIVKRGSLAGAARERKVNHSTLFRRLNQLEEELNVTLFERRSDGYQLTAQGQKLLPHAETMAQAMDSAQLSLATREHLPQGIVRLTAPDNLAYHYLPDYLNEFHGHYPQIRIELLVSNLDLNIQRREADLALRVTRQPPEQLVGRKVMDTQWQIFAATAFIRGLEENITMDSLRHLPVVGPDKSLLYLPAYQWIEEEVPPQNIVARGSNIMSVAALIRAGIGLGVLPQDQVQTGLHTCSPFPPGLTGQFWLLTHPELRHNLRIRLLMDFLTEQLRSDPRL